MHCTAHFYQRSVVQSTGLSAPPGRRDLGHWGLSLFPLQYLHGCRVGNFLWTSFQGTPPTCPEAVRLTTSARAQLSPGRWTGPAASDLAPWLQGPLEHRAPLRTIFKKCPAQEGKELFGLHVPPPHLPAPKGLCLICILSLICIAKYNRMSLDPLQWAASLGVCFVWVFHLLPFLWQVSSYIQMTLSLGFILCRWPVIQLAPALGLRDPPGSSPFTRDDFGGGPASLGEAGQAAVCPSVTCRRVVFIPFLFP